MIQRCTNPKDPFFAHYGARGIGVCERWRDFRNFLADMGERPEKTSIDRVNVDGNYEPGNCRWATRLEQNRNSRRVKITPDDVREIRRLAAAGVRKTEIAKRFNLKTPSYVFHICNRTTWRDVD